MANDRSSPAGWGAGAQRSATARLKRRFPSVGDLDRRARLRVPRFAYDYLAGGVGAELGISRNRHALDQIEIVPRYGLDVAAVDTSVMLFGRKYALPIGVAPMGLSGLVWPQADEALAAAAQRATIPFILSMVSNASVERIAGIAPDVLWFQAYATPHNDYEVTLDVIRRAQDAGAHVLVLTLDTPMRQKRLRDVRNGLVLPFRPTLRTVLDIMRAPSWALATLRAGQPRFSNFAAYLPAAASASEVATYVDQRMSGAVTWDLVARVRRAWKGPLVVKGIQHPDDAATAVGRGVDGIILSNHGGRQFDAAPAAIDVLPAVSARVGTKATIMLDGAIQSGLDALRAIACGAACVFAGRAFLTAVAALGPRGADHLTSMLTDELRAVMAQAGLLATGDARRAELRHANAFSFEQQDCEDAAATVQA
ncbi:MAG: alpha-hydroxy acid oxidase [Parvibaculaceae bacterium]